MQPLQIEFSLEHTLSGAKASQIESAIEKLASESGAESRGAIFTKTEVVEFILDLTGYTCDKPLFEMSILEPSFGGGDFLLTIVNRLLSTWQASGNVSDPYIQLKDAIRAVELHKETVSGTYARLLETLIEFDIDSEVAASLLEDWLIQDDYLLCDLNTEFDFVVGNPPYVRQEMIPAPLIAEYRIRYKTIYDRADLYIPFIERSLKLLARGGKLGFICADRWMKNKYGSPLRSMVAENYHLETYVDMVETSAFLSDVIAYPAITTISNEKPGPTRIAHCKSLDPGYIASLKSLLTESDLAKNSHGVHEITKLMNGPEPWLIESPDQMALIRRLESTFPLIEDAGCKIGIGVATGADKAFIADYESMDVEPSRKVPLVTTKDIVSGEVKWKGQGVINPYNDGPGLVDLEEFPKLRNYLEQRKDVITKRHCAQKNPENWYKTIDRINTSLTTRPKLLIPDIKGQAHIVYEPGELYPHHNLYYVTSDQWDLHALQAVLLSEVTRLFIATYSTKMRGGFMRFQAQYLRRLRLPQWDHVGRELQDKLISAGKSRDTESCNTAVFKLYTLTLEERSALGGNGG